MKLDSQDNYWVMIPPVVAADERLTIGAKLVFGRVFAMTGKYGYCYASNEYIAQGINLVKQSISNKLQELKNNDYVRLEVTRGPKNNITSRKIYPLITVQVAGDTPASTSNTRTSIESIKVLDNKISNNASVEASSKKLTQSQLLRGIQIFEKLNAPANKKTSFFRVFKDYELGMIEEAFTFSADYESENGMPKWMAFFWKLNDIKKQSGKLEEKKALT